MVDKFKKVLWYNKDLYDNILDDPNSRIWRFFDNSILFLVLTFPLVLVFESIWDNSIIYYQELIIFDAFVSSAFLLEYVYRLSKVKTKIKFILNPIRIIDLLSFLPFFLWLVAGDNLLKLLRVLRVLRILRLIKRIPLTNWFIKSLKNYTDEYRAVFTLYMIILFLGSFFVYYVEKDIVWTSFSSIWKSLWWWLVTMSTVWYGDMSPITDLWKLIWSVLIFLWPVMWALFWAVTIMVFMDSSDNDEIINRHTKLKTCTRCMWFNPKAANYCMICWKKFTNIKHKSWKEILY